MFPRDIYVLGQTTILGPNQKPKRSEPGFSILQSIPPSCFSKLLSITRRSSICLRCWRILTAISCKPNPRPKWMTMEQDSKELDVPWLKIMHAGFNVGFRWAFTSVVLGILGFLLSNGVEDSIRVILWSPVAMIAMGILFAFLGTFYICTCCFKWARWLACLFWFLLGFVHLAPFVLFPHFCLITYLIACYFSGAGAFSQIDIFWVTVFSISTLWWSRKLGKAKWIRSLWAKCLSYVNDTETAHKKLAKAIPELSKKQPLLPKFLSKRTS